MCTNANCPFGVAGTAFSLAGSTLILIGLLTDVQDGGPESLELDPL